MKGLPQHDLKVLTNQSVSSMVDVRCGSLGTIWQTWTFIKHFKYFSLVRWWCHSLTNFKKSYWWPLITICYFIDLHFVMIAYICSSKDLILIRMQHIGMCTYMYHYSPYTYFHCANIKLKVVLNRRNQQYYYYVKTKKFPQKMMIHRYLSCAQHCSTEILFYVLYNSLLFLLFKTHCPLCTAPVLSYKTYSVHVPWCVKSFNSLLLTRVPCMYG